MEREVRALSAIVRSPERPLVAVLGGAKVHDKVGVVERFLELADVLCIGGAMSFPFLIAAGHDVADSACAPQDVPVARRVLAAAADAHCRLELPRDLVVAERADLGSPHRVLNDLEVPNHWTALDIGPRTAAAYAAAVTSAATLFWNGPMGRFELAPFAAGTRRLAEAVAASSATTVVGGGETVAAMRSFGRQDRVTHLSTGGGATLELLEGRRLPGLEVLQRQPTAVQ